MDPNSEQAVSKSKPMGPWVLQALQLQDCPLHRTGDRLLVRPPAIHHADSGCCLVPFLKLRSLLREGREGDVTCSWGNCRGQWAATREEEDDRQGWDAVSLETELEGRPFLLQLPQAVAVALLNSGIRTEYPAGHVILTDGQTNSELFVVVKGSLEVMDGNLKISSIRRGECFGELSVLTRQPVSNSVKAATDCALVAISRERFAELLARFGALGSLLNRMLARRLRASNQQLENILRPGIWGNLEVFPFLSVVQSIQAGTMTGLLTITRSRGRAVFGFEKGRLKHGATGSLLGEEALLEVFRWTSGIFRFQDEPMLLEANIQGETMAVLLDALRRFDEIQKNETGSGASTKLDSPDSSLSDTRWDPQPSQTAEELASTQLDPDGTSEFEIGDSGILPPRRT